MESSAPYIAGSDTSRAAALSVESSLGELRAQVLHLIETAPRGLTCDEFEEMHGIGLNTARPRIWELLRAGLVMESGEKRVTRSGRRAAVYVRAPEGHVYRAKTTAKELLVEAQADIERLQAENNLLRHRLQVAVARVRELT